MSIATGQTFDVTIERIVPGGAGLGFAEGMTVLVPLTAPGDRIVARAERVRGRTVNGELVEVLQPGPDRITPPCPYFGLCGGCDFQHLSYEAQLAAKDAIVRDCLRRIAGMPIAPVVVIRSPEEWAYRRRARWQFDSSAESLGYYARGSHTVLDVERCLVLRPELETVRLDLRSALRDANPRRPDQEWEAAEGDQGVALAPEEPGLPAGELRVEAAGFSYRFGADSFFQTNHGLVSALIETVADGEAPQLEGSGVAVDLYCGVGLFTLPLANAFSRVYGVEMNSRAVRYAKRNASDAGLDNVSFVAQSTALWLKQRAKNLRAVDLVVIDPPRTGLDEETRAGLLRLRPRRIVSVSCDPATFARDLKALTDAGYELDGPVTVFDMFPQTHHVELVAKLSRPVENVPVDDDGDEA